MFGERRYGALPTSTREPVSAWRRLDRYGAGSLAWIAIASAFGARLLVGYAYVAFLRQTAKPQREGRLAELVRTGAAALRMQRTVSVATTNVAHGPVLAGVIRPVILLPETVAGALATPQLQLIVTHELAHARRWDNLVLLLQRLAEMFLFFHPVVWICGWVMRREAEAACDDAVVAAYGDSAGYADSLTRVAEMKCGITRRLLVNTFAAAESNFSRRVRRILSGRTRRMTLGLTAVSLIALIAVAALGLPRTAADKEELAVEKAEESLLAGERLTPPPDASPRVVDLLARIDSGAERVTREADPSALAELAGTFDAINECCDELQGKNEAAAPSPAEWGGLPDQRHREILSLLGGIENDAEGLKSIAQDRELEEGARVVYMQTVWGMLLAKRTKLAGLLHGDSATDMERGKGDDMTTKVVREGDRTWLDGVPAGHGDSNSYARGLEIVLSHVGAQADYDTIMGDTGMAFITQAEDGGPLIDGAVDVGWWPLASWGVRMRMGFLGHVVGREILQGPPSDIESFRADPAQYYRERLAPLVRASIDAGRPVMGERAPCQIVSGYDAGEPPILGACALDPEGKVGRLEEYPWDLILLGDAAAKIDREQADLAALRHAVALWRDTPQATVPAFWPQWDAIEGRATGRKSFALWAKALRDTEHMGEARWHANMCLHLGINRRSAVAYLRAMAARRPTVAGPLGTAADHYERELTELAKADVRPRSNAVQGRP